MPAVDIDNRELMVRGARGACIAAMPEVTDVSDGVERGPVEKAVLPALEVMSVKI
jgi:hypothetical protein